MTKTRIKKTLSLLLCSVLIAAMALFASGCDDKKQNGETKNKYHTVTLENGQTYGKGKTSFTFSVVDENQMKTTVTVKTEKTTVGEALLENEIIAGDNDTYGLYVKAVNGKTLDYEKDGMYWSFYVGDSYATSGVDQTEIEKGADYSFKAEKS